MHPIRKQMRLPYWDYSQNGAYFLTICAKDRKSYFSTVVGRGILDAPEIRLTRYGQYVQDALEYIAANNPDMILHNWVIMPNHLHILVSVTKEQCCVSGTSGMPRPTDALIPKLVSSLKRFTNRRAGIALWQNGYYDHIIRDDVDFIHNGSILTVILIYGWKMIISLSNPGRLSGASGMPRPTKCNLLWR